MAGVIALFVVVVGTTMAFAIVKSKDEQKRRNEKLAKEERDDHDDCERRADY